MEDAKKDKLLKILDMISVDMKKDAEDFEGDMAYGMKTVPIILGTFWTKILVVALIGLTVFMLGFLLLRYILFSVEPADYISLPILPCC